MNISRYKSLTDRDRLLFLVSFLLDEDNVIDILKHDLRQKENFLQLISDFQGLAPGLRKTLLFSLFNDELAVLEDRENELRER